MNEDKKSFAEKFPELKQYIVTINYDSEDYEIEKVCGCNEGDMDRPLHSLNTEPLDLFYGDEVPFKEQAILIEDLGKYVLSKSAVKAAIEKARMSGGAHSDLMSDTLYVDNLLSSLGLADDQGEDGK